MSSKPQSTTVKKLTELGAERLATIVASMAAPAGANVEWDSETIEHVLQPLQEPLEEIGVPWIGDTVSDMSEVRGTMGVCLKNSLSASCVLMKLSPRSRNSGGRFMGTGITKNRNVCFSC